MPYCIYTDKDVEEKDANLEHIIPLSLGGCDAFSLRVDSETNSKLGFQIDGRLTKDYLISSLRRHKNFVGHSGKPPRTVWKKSKFSETNRPIQVIFEGKESRFFDPIDKKLLPDEEVNGKRIQSAFKFDKEIRMIFTAKVLLAAGYFTYGNTFTKYADHDSLRKLMNYTISENKETIAELPLRVIDPFHEISEEDKGMKGVFDLICKGTDSSCVMFLLCTENIIGSVGIGGTYMGSINFKAQTQYFPNEEKHRLGHVLAVQEKTLRRASFYDTVAKLNHILDKRKKEG